MKPHVISLPSIMLSDRRYLIRENTFSRLPAQAPREKATHFSATLTEDHTLFLLNQLRERRTTVRRRGWIARLFRRR